MRSPKLDDPRFNERITVPRHPSLPLSARGMLFDFRNKFYFPLSQILELSKLEHDLPSLLRDLGLPVGRFRKFAETYPESDYLDLAQRQDPEDIAELDAVVDELNAITDFQEFTHDKVRALLDRVDRVYDKYKA